MCVFMTEKKTKKNTQTQENIVKCKVGTAMFNWNVFDEKK